MSILIFIIILFLLVVVHEYGHYKAAKIFNARVDEFGFGYPPKIKTLFTRGETKFTLNLLPFGGFVKIFGEDDLEKEPSIDTSRALFKKPKWQQAVVLVAGVFMNIFLAGVLLSFGLMIGLPSSIATLDSQNSTLADEKIFIKEVEKNSPAEYAGLKTNDQIKEIVFPDSTRTEPKSIKSFFTAMKAASGQPLQISFIREGQVISKSLKPVLDKTTNTYRLGVALDVIGNDVKLPFFKSIQSGFKISLIILGDIFKSLFLLVKSLFVQGSAVGAEVTGPVGLVKTVGQAVSYGFGYVLSLTALISLNLAAINILPIPALDGGRLFFLLIEKIKGSRIKPKLANALNAIFFFGLVGLMLLVTVFDVVKLVK